MKRYLFDTKEPIVLLMAFSITIFNASVHSYAQVDQLHIFDHRWQAEGTWGDGSTFKQEISFEYQLDSTIIAVRSKGFTDKEQNTYGLRNFGIRRISTSSDTSSFYEFDVFGGLTEGKMIRNNRDLHYQYQYGEYSVTDYWQYENDSTYLFTVGEYQDGVWKQKYLETKFHKVKPNSSQVALKKLKSSLVGSWKSDAWDGQLLETWSIDEQGNLIQQNKYIEQDKILYEATSKIEIIGDELILISVIKDSNPKIFKATNIRENDVTFENSEYKNPSKVTYDLGVSTYKRTISGIQNEMPTSYTFEFKKH